ncbi:hypothetical protein [Achromobacter animicus]|uniref:hypothetical protein n=1 Tax=Achromobacter animicus TaxID=1389935 RepID=UPI00345EB390
MSGIGFFALVCVAIWLILTVPCQFRSISVLLNKFDPFRLLPVWTFFAPNPGIFDYHVVARGLREDGTFSAWVAIEVGQDRHSVNLIWNPQKRPKKVILDAVQSLLIIATRMPRTPGQEIISIPYLLILHLAQLVRDERLDGCSRQFAIVQTSGHEKRTLEVIYLSQVHNN